MPFEHVSMTRMCPGGAGCTSTTKGLTSISPRFVACRCWTGQESPAREGTGCRKTSAWSEEAPPEGGVSSGGKMTMDRPRVRVGPSVVGLRYAYELGCCYFLNLAVCAKDLAGARKECKELRLCGLGR